jgi:hypothetical protein
MRGKHWKKTALMPGSKETNKVIIIIIIMISLTQIYVVIEN